MALEMNRKEIINAIANSAAAKNSAIVSNIGHASRELFELSNSPSNFYMLGSMGLASSIGLGISIAKPNKNVIVIDGDGSMLMNLGALSTISNYSGRNYHLIVIDNESHGSTGGQKTHTALKTDIAKIAYGAGIKDSVLVKDMKTLRRLIRSKMIPKLIVVKCEPGDTDSPYISMAPKEISKRFRECINKN